MPGIELQPLAGGHNGARGLFTGLVRMEPGACYPYYYARPATEALVVLEGEVALDVEDRRYHLGPRDAAVVAAREPRRLGNRSADRPALVHIALASTTPEQNWINGRFSPAEQPPGSIGRAGSERVCRHAEAPSFELTPGTAFQDFYNAQLGSMGICGGYGLFEPGARLPCHRHEYDESITIVQGTATCVVEGRRHELSGCATAMVPQGRCHYFINLGSVPMAMVWVYAGDMPDRIVVDEALCLASNQ
jgi:quercetin dioxygenase-like cupin family protein